MWTKPEFDLNLRGIQDTVNRALDATAGTVGQSLSSMKETVETAMDEGYRFRLFGVNFRIPYHAFPYPVVVTALFLLLGFVFGWWHPAWLLFLTVPFYYTMPAVRRAKTMRGKLNRFPYPVAVTLAYLCCGFFLHWWVFPVLLFFTIPIYYILAQFAEG